MIGMTVDELTATLSTLPETPTMPVLFVGHGSPMHGIEDSVYARGWKTLGDTLPRPHAILAISAHWLTDGTEVHVEEHPKTIHDFFGFPDELYRLTYPAPGAHTVAHATQALVTDVAIKDDRHWGIDHGAWIVLHRMYPEADVPVFQLSIDIAQKGDFHYALGRALAPLRRRGVLILGSGNIVHNLREVDFRPDAPEMDWAVRFDTKVAAHIEARTHQQLIDYPNMGADALRAIPSPDHYFPLLSVLGASTPEDVVSFPVAGIDLGSISMRSVLFTPKQ